MDIEDKDEDGVPNTLDNCVDQPNKNQEDMDGDGRGDRCDEDLDGDNVQNQEDNCINVVNPIQSDFDGDGFGDLCDNCV
ncbi:MAG: thrombospondin, partial [Zetaproteobacteria bacterium]|nr:thrombospondin [Pseudobdellovibrionaceae bacterium]